MRNKILDLGPRSATLGSHGDPRRDWGVRGEGRGDGVEDGEGREE